MASLIYNSFWEDLARGAIDLDTDTFKGMLLTASYTEDKDAHTKRSHLSAEVSGTGYTAGGNAVTMTVEKDTANDRVNITIAVQSWSNATITARYLAIYKSRGGASSADELVCLIDFGSNITSTASTFAVSDSTIRIQN